MSDPSTLPALSLVPSQTDRELATGIKAKLQQTLVPVLDEITTAKASGFDVTFSIQTDGFGKSFLSMLRITKEF